MVDAATARATVRDLCASLPEAELVGEGQHRSCVVRSKKFAWVLDDHHGNGRLEFQCKAERGLNQSLAADDPERYFLPPYMAQHGWIGLYLDRGEVDWDLVERYLRDAYRLVAPKTLVRRLDG